MWECMVVLDASKYFLLSALRRRMEMLANEVMRKTNRLQLSFWGHVRPTAMSPKACGTLL
jgi:hypothetical protein